jgi:hypothetical protein
MTDSDGNERREVDIDQELKNAELRYRRLFASVQDGILILDAADDLLFDPASKTLANVAGRGFHGKTIGYARQPLGKGYARIGDTQY